MYGLTCPLRDSVKLQLEYSVLHQIYGQRDHTATAFALLLQCMAGYVRLMDSDFVPIRRRLELSTAWDAEYEVCKPKVEVKAESTTIMRHEPESRSQIEILLASSRELVLFAGDAECRQRK